METKDFNRFETKILPITETGCHVWLGSDNGSGYGKFHLKGKEKYAHRVSYEHHKGEIPLGMFVCHKCDTPSCVNPEHLFIGSNVDNMKDMVSKGRYPKRYGENAPCWKGGESYNYKKAVEKRGF